MGNRESFLRSRNIFEDVEADVAPATTTASASSPSRQQHAEETEENHVEITDTTESPNSSIPPPPKKAPPKNPSLRKTQNFHALLYTQERNLPTQIIAFGLNQFNQLQCDEVTTTKKSLFETPTILSNISRIRKVACGSHCTLLLTQDHRVLACGDDEGHVGLPPSMPSAKKLETVTLSVEEYTTSTFTDVAIGSKTHFLSHSIYSSPNGTFFIGKNSEGQFGLKDLDYVRKEPRFDSQVYLHVACGGSHSIFVTCEHEILSCGDNSLGQLGIAATVPKRSHTPLQVQLPLKRGSYSIKKVTCGESHTAILTKSGALFLFGSNQCGQTGLGATMRIVHTPTLALTSSGNHECIVDVDCGKNFTVAATIEGSVYVFGENTYGQLGVDQTIIQMPRLLSTAQFNNLPIGRVAAGWHHTLCAAIDPVTGVMTALFGAGQNDTSQVGIPKTQASGNVTRFRQLELPMSEKNTTESPWYLVDMSCGYKHSVVVIGIMQVGRKELLRAALLRQYTDVLIKCSSPRYNEL